jgi:AbiV family abortive infection protein
MGANGLFGPAVSFLVLSLEEAEKARALIAIVTGDDSSGLSDDELRDIIYWDHKARHVAAFTHSISRTTLAKLVKPARRFTPLLRKQFDADMAALAWHLDANSLKQRGLYVDYKSNRWQTPRELTEEDFSRGLQIVKRFVEVTVRLAASVARVNPGS